MTIKQKQCLLCYLGYYRGAVDGIWGPLSQQAAMAFQKDYGMEADGIFDPETEKAMLSAIAEGCGDWWADIRYFTPGEFACKCGRYCDGYPAEMDQTLIQAADRLRSHFGAPVTVSSGLRCSKHNAAVGGVANSRHLSGKAMDFCVSGHTAEQVLAYIRQQPQIRYAYAIDGMFVHMDVA